MRQKRINKPWTTTEIAKVCEMYYNDNLTARTIAELTGRSLNAVKQAVRKNRAEYIDDEDQVVKVPTQNIATPPSQTSKTVKMEPREMIKALYDMGYRIENNQLVCHVRQVVKLQDIING